MNKKKKKDKKRKESLEYFSPNYRNARVLHTVDNGRLPGTAECKDSQGRTALDLAREVGREEVFKLGFGAEGVV